MPQLRQSSLQTKSKSRGSISLLSIVWCVITIVGMTAITRATVVVHQRATVQTIADSVALAAADHGDDVARTFARTMNVEVLAITRNGHAVTVRITANNRTAIASALRPM